MDSRSFVFALKACEQFKGFFVGEFVHSVVWKIGFDSQLLVRNAFIHFYSECDQAMELFKLMLLGDVEPNEVTLIAVLSACSEIGDLEMGKRVCGSLVDAKELFDRMETRDIYSSTSMVNGYAKFTCRETTISALKAAKLRWPTLFDNVDSATEDWIVEQMITWKENRDDQIELFGKVRDDWLEKDFTGWIQANRFYLGITDALKFASSRVYIVTKKQLGSATGVYKTLMKHLVGVSEVWLS
ncbi:pentatricopeptide repeat-containing protein mitochondrial-like [Trifolium pratense]|uniref:Pentatricopeptide repeat-containing protein mitochondrial-like n=1 Tax=Trifolium pratense TaxID=57577 RepID=A0A2K3N770_TRIPR|nr:pentatricopeptide repeat-containing protein mitochondrial-like [Trifolium pratense]